MKLHDLGIPYNWNMNLAFLMQLDKRREDKAQAAMMGDMSSWWSALWEMFESISPLLEQKEHDDVKAQLEDVFKDLRTALSKKGHDAFLMDQYIKRALYTSAAEELRKISLQITDLMFKYQIIDMKRQQKSIKERLKDGTRNK